MSLKKGDIVLAHFPFSDLSETKLRPAIVLWVDQYDRDVTVCFISSQNVNILEAEEFTMNPSDLEFAKTGLKIESKVRVSKIATLKRVLLTRRIGQLGIDYLKKLNHCLTIAFQL
jgi:mRNA interferase MazF